MKITLVGFGPRNLSLFQLIAKTNREDIEVNIFEPFTVGGEVWDPFIKHNEHLLLNTVASQITIFNDLDKNLETIPDEITKNFISFYQWIEKFAYDYIQNNNQFSRSYLENIEHIGPNDFAPRGLLGIYLSWFYEQIKTNVKVNLIQEKVVDIKDSDGITTVISKNHSIESDYVVLALGHPQKDFFNKQEESFNDLALKTNDIYVTQSHPSEVDLTVLPPNKKVLFRGLGLSFYDYIYLISIDRGGVFKNGIYKSSGEEPIVYAGSRSGLPLKARGHNQKGPSETYSPIFFTKDNLSKFKNNNGQITYDDFFSLLNKEMQWVHYNNIVKNDDYKKSIKDPKEFINELRISDADEFESIALKHNVSDELIWSWDKILNVPNHFKNEEEFREWYIDYLERDIKFANMGNVDAPFTASFEILRDVRNTIRNVVEDNWFDDENYGLFLKKFNHINSMLSVGPPVQRVELLLELIKNNILKIVGPGMEVTVENNKYKLETDFEVDNNYFENLVEARLNTINITQNAEPLQLSMKKKGKMIPFYLNEKNLGATDINKKTFNLIFKNGDNKNIFSFGIPHENEKWFTTVIPRPAVKTIIFKEANQIFNQIFN